MSLGAEALFRRFPLQFVTVLRPVGGDSAINDGFFYVNKGVTR